MEYIAKVMQIKHGRTVTEKVFQTMDDAKEYLSKYQSRHKYTKKSCIARITEENYHSIIQCFEFISNHWVTV